MKKLIHRKDKADYKNAKENTRLFEVGDLDFKSQEPFLQCAFFAGDARVLVPQLIKDFKLQILQIDYPKFICLMGAGDYFDSLEFGIIDCRCMQNKHLMKQLRMRKNINNHFDIRAMVEFLRNNSRFYVYKETLQ